jgi:hypothetical protein
MIPGMRVSGWLELLRDHCRSRENCTRKWLTNFTVGALVIEAFSVSVATFSVPLSEMP